MAVIAVSFVLFSTYLYSGLCKLNTGFIESVWQKMILTRYLKLPAPFMHSPLVYYAGYGIPLFEIFSAVLLLFVKTRKAAALLLILTHLFNLLFLGPFGINYNVIVWPWNVAMMTLLYFIFIKHASNNVTFFAVFNKKLLWVFIVWGILPLTSYVGFWDEFLSSSIYSGKSKHLLICIVNKNQAYPSELIPFFNKALNGNICPGKQISATNWALKEMKVPCYPEQRVYEQLESALQKRYKGYEYNFTIYRGRDKLRGY